MHSSDHCQSSLVWLIKWKHDFFLPENGRESHLFSTQTCNMFNRVWHFLTSRINSILEGYACTHTLLKWQTLSNAIKAFHFISPENGFIGWHIRCNLHTLLVIWRCFTWCSKIFFHYSQCQSPVRLFFSPETQVEWLLIFWMIHFKAQNKYGFASLVKESNSAFGFWTDKLSHLVVNIESKWFMNNKINLATLFFLHTWVNYISVFWFLL